MTRIEALKAMLAKMEAGDKHYHPGKDFHLAMGGSNFEWMGATKGALECDRAYHGSLDAAKALHEAISTPDAVMTPEEMDAVLFHPLGARFWLSWKIRALIAQEEASVV